MSVLPAKCKAALLDLAMSADRRLTKSRNYKGRKTKDSRLAWYLFFCEKHHIDDPCLEFYSMDVVDTVIGCYVESLIQGNNIKSKTIRANTINNYLSAVAIPFADRNLNFPPASSPKEAEQRKLSKRFGVGKTLRTCAILLLMKYSTIS